MTDRAFETRLERVLRGYAQSAVRPIDAVEIAGQAMAADVRSNLGWLAPAQRMAWLTAATVVAALLLAGIALLLAGGQRELSVTPPSSAPAVTPLATDGPLPIELAGTWLADKPDGLSFGDPSGPARMSLVVDGSFTYVVVSSSPFERLGMASTGSADTARFSAQSPGDPVTLDGSTLRGCAIGEAGSYRLTRSPDGLRLALDVVDDPCPSRSAVFARTWTRSLGGPSTGGLGVVDAFDPLFTVDLPAGTYTVNRSIDALTIHQEIPEFQFLAFRDPQGFNDPCDPRGGGRYPIAPGADALVSYFRQLRGFTVDSTTELIVDGRRAVRLVVHADPDASCPDGRLVQWQPKAETGDTHWFLRPGATDSLVIVELADATLMFEVLPAPNALEADVIDSIRFLERLPGTP